MPTPPNIDLVALDLDHTTLTSDRLPHPDNIYTIARAREAGLQVVVASGRISTSIRPFGEVLGANGSMICCNGAHVLGPSGEELACHVMDPSVLDTVLDYAVLRNIHVNVYTRIELLFLTRSPWAEEYERRLVTLKPRYTTVEEAKSHELIKVSLIDAPEAIQEHIKVLAPMIDPALARPTESEPEYLEFMHPLSNKGNGLQVLAAHLGIGNERVAAIGDYLNDLEMLNWAGYSGAVANAAEAVKAVVDVIVPSNDEGGVARFIDEILSHRRQ